MNRNSSIDIFRIFATFQVILWHLVSWHYKNQPYEHGFPLSCLSFNCNFDFILISSYVIADSTFKFSKLLPTLIDTSSSTFLLKTIIHYFLGFPLEINLTNIIIYLTPNMHNISWYTTSFVYSRVLFATIFPTLKKMTYFFHIKTIFVILSMHFLTTEKLFLFTTIGKCGVGTFIVAALVGSYIRFYPPTLNKKSITFLIIFIIVWLNALNYVDFSRLYFIPGIKTITSNYFVDFSSLVIATIYLIFVTNLNFQTNYSSIYKNIAELSLGVYVLNRRPYVTKYWLNAWELDSKIQFPLKIFLNPIIIIALKTFFVSGILTYIKNKIFNIILFHRKYYKYIINLFDYENVKI